MNCPLIGNPGDLYRVGSDGDLLLLLSTHPQEPPSAVNCFWRGSVVSFNTESFSVLRRHNDLVLVQEFSSNS